MVCPECKSEYSRSPEDGSATVCEECRNFLDVLEAARHSIRKALKLSMEGQHEVALVKLREVISNYSNRCRASWLESEILGYMAVVRENANDDAGAVELYRDRQRPGFRTMDSYLANQSGLADALHRLGESEAALQETRAALDAITEETLDWALPHLAFYIRVADEARRTVPASVNPLIQKVAATMGHNVSDEALNRDEGRAAVILELQKLKESSSG